MMASQYPRCCFPQTNVNGSAFFSLFITAKLLRFCTTTCNNLKHSKFFTTPVQLRTFGSDDRQWLTRGRLMVTAFSGNSPQNSGFPICWMEKTNKAGLETCIFFDPKLVLHLALWFGLVSFLEKLSNEETQSTCHLGPKKRAVYYIDSRI